VFVFRFASQTFEINPGTSAKAGATSSHCARKSASLRSLRWKLMIWMCMSPPLSGSYFALLLSARLGDDPDVRPGLLPRSEEVPGLVVRDGARDDHVVALPPVDRRRDLVLRSQLQRVDDAEHLVEVAAGGHRVDEDQLDLLVGADDEHVANG